jgi:sigma-B regulation protein RsbU (phosphoserine phosphatase)
MKTANEAEAEATILVVDDTPANLRLLTQILSRSKYKVRVANSGQRALDAIHSSLPDLILLDIMMPEMSGYEVCQRLKADEEARIRELPIIFLSALDNTQNKLKAFAVGGVDYITKPFQPAEMLARVKTHLSLRSLQKALEEKNALLRRANDELVRLNDNLTREITERVRAQTAEQVALQREMNLAQDIQTSLLPMSTPTIAGIDVSGICIPARHVGGDLYGFYELPPSKQNPHSAFALAVGDVSGKGVPAALYMAVCATMLAAKAPFVPDVAQLLGEMNAALYPYTSPNRMNVALCYARFEPGQPGSHTLHLANAGMVAPILRRGTGCEYLDVGGLPLGSSLTAAPYSSLELSLQPGDVLVLTSDGVVEATNANGEMYSFERLLARVSEAPAGRAKQIQEWLLAGLRAFTANTEIHDDVTLAVAVLEKDR